MAEQDPSHLLSSLGILKSFSIAKKISKEEVLYATKKIKKIYKEKSPEKIQELLKNIFLTKTKNCVATEMPPGFIFPKKNPNKEMLDKYYMELSIIAQTLSSKFVEQKLTKIQVCFIINAIVNLLGLGESDFEEFQKKFQKYKDNDYNEYE